MADFDFSGIPDATQGQQVAQNTAPAQQYNFDGVDQKIAEAKFGSPGQQTLAAAEGFARGLSFGASDLAAIGLGISDPKNVKGRMDASPWVSGAGTMVGAAIPSLLTFGAAAPEEAAGIAASQAAVKMTITQMAEKQLIEKGINPIAARAMAVAAEGSAFGAGQVVTDYSLGDPNLNAQKIAATIGFGAALGGGLGLLSKGIEAVPGLYKQAFGRGEQAVKPAVPGATGTVEEAAAGVGAPAVDPAGGAKVYTDHTMGLKPTSIEEMAKRVENSKFSGESYALPEKKLIEEITARVGHELENPPHQLQIDSLADQSANDLFKTAREMPGNTGDTIRKAEAVQKNELTYKVGKAIEELSPETKPLPDAVAGGNRASEIFSKQYQDEKALLGPAFEELKKLKTANEFGHTAPVIKVLSDAVPGVSRMIDTASGELKILPYSSKFGIDRATYNAAKEAIQDVSGIIDVQDLVNVRKGLDQHVNMMVKGQASSEIGAMKAAMMDYIQGEVASATSAAGSDVTAVRELFKKYAINEQQRGVIEKVFHASVGSPEFGAVSKVKPEMILDTIFGNTANVNAAKNILSTEDFNELLSHWLAEHKALVTDKGAFSSNKFATFLKKNQDALKVATVENPNALQRIHDFTDLARMLPDAVSGNPSGTAKTLWGTLKAHSIPELLGNLKGYGKEKLQQYQVTKQVDEALAGAADRTTRLQALDKMQKKVTDKIESGAKSIFTGGARGATERGAVLMMSDKEYKDNTARIKELSSDPTALMNHLGDSSEALYAAAPNITQSLNNTLIAGIQFLDSKIPKALNDLLLGHKQEASPDQRMKFSRYFHAVNDPIGALKSIKTGTLTNEALEAITAVHPDLLADMKKAVVFNLDPEKARALDYPVKISLAKFLGQPLDTNMIPQVRASYQVALQGPSLSKNQGPKGSAALQKSGIAKRTGSIWDDRGDG